MTLTQYRTLGRSGLLVSPLSLGTMTFGAQGWGADEKVAEGLFNAYVDAGGNAIDTADVYTGGRSEEMVGRFIKARSLRTSMVLATKCGFNMQKGNPHGGGNGRKHIYQSVEASLRRLHTDYIDLYWMHVWDTITPAEEVLQTLTDLTSAGKIRYFGLSDCPAWYAAKMATLAARQHTFGPVALQLEYSLVERNIENEHIPAAKDCGMGVVPWSPLAGGFLSGKYTKENTAAADGGRLSKPNPFGDTKFNDKNWNVLETLMALAKEAGQPPAAVALAWVVSRQGVGSTIIGASKLAQLQDNLSALEVHLSKEQMESLDKASEPSPVFPYPIYKGSIRNGLFGGHEVNGWQ